MRTETKSMWSSQRGLELPPCAPLPVALQTLAAHCWPLGFVEWARAHLGKRFTIYPLDMPPLVFLSDPQEIRAVVSAPADVLHPGAGSRPITPLIGDDAFILREEEEHLCARNATLPALGRRAVQAHEDMIGRTIAQAIAALPTDCVFPAHAPIRAMTLAAIVNALFPGEDARWRSTLAQQTLRMLAITDSFLLQAPRLRRFPHQRARWRKFLKDRARVEGMLFELIKRRRSTGERGDLLDGLLGAANPDGQAMSDKQVHDHLMSMIVAGHETTAAQVAWAFQLLAQHPAAQDQIRQEADNSDDRAYLRAVMHEALRHRPAFMFAVPREVMQPIQIGGLAYPPGVHLVPCTYLMHHDPGLYGSPHDFMPERFLEGVPQPGAFLPWGAGRKRCVGRHFALIEMEAIMRETLVATQIEPASDTLERARWRSAILVPDAGCRVVLRKRIRPTRQARPSSTPLTACTAA